MVPVAEDWTFDCAPSGLEESAAVIYTQVSRTGDVHHVYMAKSSTTGMYYHARLLTVSVCTATFFPMQEKMNLTMRTRSFCGASRNLPYKVPESVVIPTWWGRRRPLYFKCNRQGRICKSSDIPRTTSFLVDQPTYRPTAQSPRARTGGPVEAEQSPRTRLWSCRREAREGEGGDDCCRELVKCEMTTRRLWRLRLQSSSVSSWEYSALR